MKLSTFLSYFGLAIGLAASGCGGGGSNLGGGSNNQSNGGNNNSSGGSPTGYNDSIALSNGQTGTLAIVIPSTNTALGTLVVSSAGGTKAPGASPFPAGTYLLTGNIVNGLINFTGGITQNVFNLNNLNPSIPTASAFDIVYGGVTYPGTATITHIADVETWPVAILITGSNDNVTNVQVSVSYAGYQPVNGPNGGYGVGGAYTLPVTGVNDTHYTVTVPSNQPAASYCTVTSGATGYLGSFMPTAVVTCQ